MNEAAFEKLLFKLNNSSHDTIISIDIETTGLERADEIVCAAIAFKNKESIETFSFWLDRFHEPDHADESRFIKILSMTLFKPSFEGTVVFHNMDFDLKMILDRFHKKDDLNFSELSPLMDTLTISRLSKNNKYIAHTDPDKISCHSLKYLARDLLKDDSHTTFEEAVEGKNIRTANKSSVLKYNEKDAALTADLYQYFKKTLSAEEWNYLESISIPQLKSIIHMNWYGVPFNFSKAQETLKGLNTFIEQKQLTIFKRVGRSFNIKSQKELSSALLT